MTERILYISRVHMDPAFLLSRCLRIVLHSLLVIVVTMYCLRPCAAVDGTLEVDTQFAGLEALFNATNGHNWTTSNGWGNKTLSFCDWYGVTCGDGSGNVTSLSLSDNGLEGNLSSTPMEELSDITSLKEMNLSSNRLFGPVPLRFGLMPMLEKLDLSGNELSSFPASWGSGATSLRYLSLQDNKISGSLPSMWSSVNQSRTYPLVHWQSVSPWMPELHSLLLGGNSLDSTGYNALQAIVTLASLQVCDFSDNALTGSVEDALTLYYCDGSGSMGCSGSASGVAAPSLRVLKLDGNNLTGLEALFNVTNGEESTNSDDGEDPTSSVPWDVQFAGLEALFNATNGHNWTASNGWGNKALSFCDWYGVTCGDGSGDVTSLSLSDNGLEGNLSSTPMEELTNITSLKEMNLSSNRLFGPLPLRFGLMPMLEILDLSGNELSSIPSSWGSDASSLRYLSLQDNKISGSLPSMWSSVNQSGAYPLVHWQSVSLWMPELHSLLLGGNSLDSTGYAALQAIVTLASLQVCDFSDNALTGSVEDALTLYYCDGLGSMGCSGSASGVAAPLLRVLKLDGNNLTGIEALFNVTNGEESTNSGDGEDTTSSVPWGVQFAGLEALFNATNGHNWTTSNGWGNKTLSFCDWYGVTCGDGSGDVTSLSLSDNGLEGNLSSTPMEELTDVASLKEMNLSSNRLFGPVPLRFGLMPMLEILDLSGNELSSIPASWGSGASSLRYLSLQDNTISGSLPSMWSSVNQSGAYPLVHWQSVSPWMPELRSLLLGGNSLDSTGYAALQAIVTLASLQVCDFSDNALTGSVEDALTLYYCDGSGNTGCSGSASGVAAPLLRVLKLDGNNLTGIEALFNVTNGEESTNSGDGEDTTSSVPWGVQFAGLEALFNATNGHNWTASNGWGNKTLSFCDWYGVTCGDGSGDVMSLSLSDNGLEGNLSSTPMEELTNITSLKEMNLSSNRLFGPVPLRFGLMPMLEKLDLSGNELSSIPSSWGSGATSLRYLSLQDNTISGSLPSMWSSVNQSGAYPLVHWQSLSPWMPELHSLLLGGNSLDSTGYATLQAIVTLASLQVCDFSDNALTGSVEDALTLYYCDGLGSMGCSGSASGVAAPSLRVLKLDGNNLTGIEALFNTMNGEESTNSGDGENTTSVPWDVQFAGLQALFNATNGHSWTASNGWGNKTLSFCDWYGVTCGDGSGDVTSLSLSDNGLEGNLSSTPMEELTNITSLKEVDLSSNRLFGPVPLRFGLMPMLEKLDLSGNELSSIPASWGSDASSLRYLSLQDNKISGSLPSMWSSVYQDGAYPLIHLQSVSPWMPELRSLLLGGNSLDSTGYAALQAVMTLKSLQVCDFSGNALTGLVEDALTLYYCDGSGSMGCSGSALGVGAPSLRVLKLDGNNLADNPGINGLVPDSYSTLKMLFADGTALSGSQLPSFVATTSGSRYESKHELSVCGSTEPSPDEEIAAVALEPSYDGFSLCTCSDGFEGSHGNCTKCSQGWYRNIHEDGQASDDCVACPTNSTTLQKGNWLMSQCVCSANFYDELGGRGSGPSCVQCPSGSRTLTAGAASVTACKCPPGYIFDFAASDCQACAAGTYKPGYGNQPELCLPCPYGTYYDMVGATSFSDCVACPLGFYGDSYGATSVNSCKRCPAGTYGAAEGLPSISLCTACWAGYYSPTLGANSSSMCIECPSKHSQPNTGAVSLLDCIPCIEGQVAGRGFSECIVEESPDGTLFGLYLLIAGLFLVVLTLVWVFVQKYYSVEDSSAGTTSTHVLLKARVINEGTGENFEK